MSIRYLFSDGNFTSIPGVGDAENGQVLTAYNGTMQWITPGAGPTGPIQGVEGTTNQIVASPPNLSGIVTLSLPDEVDITGSLTIAAESGNGYQFPLRAVDNTDQPLISGTAYAMRYDDIGGGPNGTLTFVETSTVAGVSSIAGTTGINASASTGAVTLSLGDIQPDKVTVNGAYILPTTLGAANEVIGTDSQGSAQLIWTAKGSGGGITTLQEGNSITITNASGPTTTVALSSAVVAQTSLTVGTSTNAYTFPNNNAALVNDKIYALGYVQSTQELEFTEIDPIISVTSVQAPLIGSGINVNNTSATQPILSLTDIIPTSVNVNNAYKLPTESGAQNYVLTLGAAVPGEPTPVSWLPQGTTTAGVNTVQGTDGITPTTAEPGNVVLGLADITPSSVSTASVTVTNLLTIGSGVDSYTLPPSNVGLVNNDTYALKYNESVQQLEFIAATSGSGTVTSIVEGANILVSGTTPTVNPTVGLNPVLTGITSVAASGQITASELSLTNSVAGSSVLSAGQFRLINGASANALTLRYDDAASNTGFQCVSGTAGLQVITEYNPVSPATEEQGYILPTVGPTAAGQVLTVQTVQSPTGTAFATTEWATPAAGGVTSVTGTVDQITTSATTGAVTLALASNLIVESNNQTFSVTDTEAAADGASLKFDAVNGVSIGKNAQYYKLPLTLPTSGQQVLASTAAGAGELTWQGLQSGGGTITGVNGTTNQITAVELGGEVTLSIPLDFDLTQSNVSQTTIQKIKLGDFSVTQTSIPGNSQTSVTYQSAATDLGIFVDNEGLAIYTGAANNYLMPTTLPAVGQVISCSDVTDGVATCEWSTPSAGGVTSVTGTANKITATPTSGAVVLTLPAEVDLTLATSPTESESVIFKAGDVTITQAVGPNPRTLLNYRDPTTLLGATLDRQGVQVYTSDLVNTYSLPTTLPTEPGQVLTSGAFDSTENNTPCVWQTPSGGGSINSVTGTAGEISAVTTAGAVVLSLPNAVNLTATATANKSLTVGQFSVSSIEVGGVGNTTLAYASNSESPIGFSVSATGFDMYTSTQGKTYTWPTEYPPGNNYFLATSNVAGNGALTTWVEAPAGGVTSVTGTANKIIATPTTGAVVLSLPTEVDLTLAASPTTSTNEIFKAGDLSITQVLGSAPETVLEYKDATTKLGFQANNEGVSIFTGATNTSYTMPVTNPTAVGQVLYCSAIGTDATTSWGAGVSLQEDDPLIGITMTGFGIDSAGQKINLQLGGDITPGGGVDQIDIKLAAFGSTKFVEITWDAFNGNLGCLFPPPANPDATLVLAGIQTAEIDISNFPYLVPHWLPSGQDMNIGTLSYYSLVGGTNQTTAAYGTCAVTLGYTATAGPPATSTIHFKFTFLPKSTTTGAIADNTYCVQQNNRLMVSSCVGLKATPATALNNFSPSGKSYFTYL